MLDSDGEQLKLGFHNYDRPIGIAIDAGADRLAVAARDLIWIAYHDPSVAEQIPAPVARCLLTRSADCEREVGYLSAAAWRPAWGSPAAWIIPPA